MVAELSAPSTGTGFMIARAVALGKPVLSPPRPQRCRPRSPAARALWAKRTSDDASFKAAVRASVVGKAAGAPGRGRRMVLGVRARLASELGLVHISTGDVLRELVRDQPAHPLARADRRARSSSSGSTSLPRGCLASSRDSLLDGCPPSREDLANLFFSPRAGEHCPGSCGVSDETAEGRGPRWQ